MAQPKLAMDLVEQRIAEHANLPKSSKPPPPPMAVPLLQPLTRDGAPTSGRQPDANERARRAMQAEHFRHQVAMVLQESELFNEGDDAEDGCSDKNDNMATLTALDYGFEVELPRELDYAEAMEVLGEALAARVECSLKVFVHWTGAESDAWDRLDGAHDEDDSDFEDVTDDADGTDEDGDSDGDSESSEMKTSFARFYVPLVSNTNTNEFESQPEIFDAELLSQLQCNINAALDELLGGKVTLKPLVPFTADTAALIDRFTEFLPRLEREMGLQLWCTEERGFDEEHVKDALEAIGLRAKAVEPYAATQKYQCMISDLFGMNENDEESGDCSGEHDHSHAHEHGRKQSHDHSHSGDCCSDGDHAEDEEEEDDLELFQVAFAQNPVDADGNITGDYAPIRMLQFVLFFPYSLDPLAAWKAIQLAVQHTRAIFQAQGYRMEERYIGLWEDAASAKKKRSMSKAVLMEKSLAAMITAVGEFGFRLGDEAFQRLFE